MSKRNNQKQIWADIDFIMAVDKIRAQRTLVGKPVKNIGQLTKEMTKCASFRALAKELIDPKEMMHLHVRIDRKDIRRGLW